MTLDRLLRDAGDHVDALIDRHLGSVTEAARPTTPSNDKEPGLMTIVDDPPRTGEPTSRPRPRWTLVAAAAAALLLIAGIVAVQRDDEDEPTDLPAASSLVGTTSIQQDLIGRLVFDGKDLWAVRNGSTFLLRMRADTGEVLDSLSLPEAATPGRALVHDGALYVPTTSGVVLVNLATRQISESRAVGDGEVWAIAFTSDSVWLVRRVLESETLERWTPDLSQRVVSVDLGAEPSVGIIGVGDKLYLATADDGLKRYDATGNVQATIVGTGVAWEMAAGDDGTLWIADFFAGDLVAVDTTTDTVRTRVQISSTDVMSLAVTPSSLWVTAPNDRKLVVVDPATGVVTATAPLRGTPTSLTLTNGAAWVSAEGGWAERFVPG